MISNLDPIEKFKVQKRENELFARLGIRRDLTGVVHQIDILEAIVKRIEELERKRDVRL